MEMELPEPRRVTFMRCPRRHIGRRGSELISGPLYGQRTKTSDRLTSGRFATSRCLSGCLASSTALAGFTSRTILERSDLGYSNENEQSPVWLLRTSGSSATGRCVHRDDRHSRAAALSRRNDRGIGHDSRVRVNPSVGRPSLVLDYRERTASPLLGRDVELF